MIRIFIVAQSIVTQAGLAALLTTEPDLEIVGSAIRPAVLSSAISAQRNSEGHDSLEPDILLLEWDPQDSLTTVLDVDVPVVLLIDEIVDESISDYLQAGIRAILPSDASSDELVYAIKAASVGLNVLHPDVLTPIVPLLPTFRTAQPVPLTAREIEVLTMLAEGLGNKAIARRLNLSEHTVKFHISSIFSKLNVSSRTEAVMMGARQGWILL